MNSCGKTLGGKIGRFPFHSLTQIHGRIRYSGSHVLPRSASFLHEIAVTTLRVGVLDLLLSETQNQTHRRDMRNHARLGNAGMRGSAE